MKTILLLFTLTAFFINSQAQSDLLVMKKKNQTLQTWIPGSTITFQFSSKQWIQGIIRKIRNDSILIEQIDVRQVANGFGFPTLDTARLGLLQLHVNEIYGMPLRQFGGSIFTNGALLELGSGAYIFLNVFNSLLKGDPVFAAPNPTRLGIAGGVFLLGLLQQSTHKTYLVMGKKYRMATIHTGAN